jgi:hypothetical protein
LILLLVDGHLVIIASSQTVFPYLTKMSAASGDIEAFVLLACAVALILLRTYVRLDLAGLKKLKPDDYLMLVTGVRLYNFRLRCPP